MRYFELIDDKSSKFWEIYNSWNTEPQYIETRFGKIGSDGRVSKIVYHTLKEGTDMENKLIQQKRKRGYVEKDSLIIIRGDKDVNYGKIVEVMDIIRTLDNIKIAISTDPS